MPKNLFDASLYDFATPQPSYWEATAGPSPVTGTPLESEESCEVAVIGGGYTGASAALHLARDFGVDVRVLEAGHFGWGASGRNGGFCCMGGTPLTLKQQVRRWGRDETKAYWRMQVEAVELVGHLLEEENIDAQRQGDGEFCVAESARHFAGLVEDVENQRQLLGHAGTVYSADAFRDIGYDAPHVHGAVLEQPSFGLHPLRYVQGLAAAAERHGAHLHPHSEVVSWSEAEAGDGRRHLLETRGGKVRARHVIVTGNGFLPEHLHGAFSGRVLPLQSVIAVTRPLTSDERAAHHWVTENPAINSLNVYCYYRLLPDNRLMIGGRGDFTGRSDRLGVTQDYLRATIARLWPEWSGIEIDYLWRGLVCFSSRLAPTVGRVPEDPTVSFGFAYHGNGVNNATWTGRSLAHWLAGGNDQTSPTPEHMPAMVRGFSPRFPLPHLRRRIAQAGVLSHKLADWWDGLRS
ncbi:MAG: FAD-binding oxidoreductase [Pseudomonadota bacterium]